MKCQTRKIGFYDNQKIKKFLSTNFHLWENFIGRQLYHKVHRATKSIPLKGDDWKSPDNLDWSTFIEVPQPSILKEEGQHMLSTLGVTFAQVKRMAFVLLPPYSKVLPHYDAGKYFEHIHRCHWVIQTSPEVTFFVEEKPYYMAEGEIWEVSNVDLHAVENKSNIGRIHLIFDWLEE